MPRRKPCPLYDPPLTIADFRDFALVDLAEASGEWLTLDRLPSADAARAAVADWYEHADAGRWPAFAFCRHGKAVIGRHIGMRFRPAKKSTRQTNVSEIFAGATR